MTHFSGIFFPRVEKERKNGTEEDEEKVDGDVQMQLELNLFSPHTDTRRRIAMRESIATPRQPSRGLKRFGKLTLFQGDS